MRLGWTAGLRVAMPDAKIEMVGVGGPPCLQFGAYTKIDFSLYDLVIFDTIPNDEEIEDRGFRHDFVTRVFFELISTFSSKSKLIVLGITNERYLDSASSTYEARRKAATACGAQFVDTRQLISRYGRALVAEGESLYRDQAHPNLKIAALIGFLLGQSFLDPKVHSLSYGNSADFSRSFSTLDTATILPYRNIIAKKNSIFDEGFVEALPGDKINIPDDWECLGFYLDRADTKCRMELHYKNGRILTTRLLYQDIPGRFAMAFYPFREYDELSHVVVVPRLEIEPEFPEHWNSLPNRILFGKFVLWNGSSRASIPDHKFDGTNIIHDIIEERLSGHLTHWKQSFGTLNPLYFQSLLEKSEELTLDLSAAESQRLQTLLQAMRSKLM